MALKKHSQSATRAARAPVARAPGGGTTGSARSAKGKKVSRSGHQRESPDVRRKSLIQATMRSIAKYGYAGTTIGSICAEAQVSRGLINHHFGTKEELIRQSYMELCEEWAFQTRDMLTDGQGDPEEKLRAMIRVSFGPTVFKTDHLGIWVGFWSVIGKSPTLKKINRELYKQDRDTYQRAFDAIALGALMDGLWLEWCLDPKGFSPEEAEAACLDLVTRTFA